MAVEIGSAISLLSQRIVAAPPSVEPPGPIGAGTIVKRYREGLILEPQARLELASLGYAPLRISQEIIVAQLEREFDDFADRLDAVEQAFNKDIISEAEMKMQVLTLLPDQAKALLVVQLLDYKKRPKPKAVTAEEAPTLSVAKLIAAWKAGVLSRPDLARELAERGYSAEDVEIMIRTEEAKLPKPKPAALKLISLADLRAMLAAGIILPQEFRAELVERTYSPEDADRILGLELARQAARIPTPTPEEFKRLPLGDVKALFSLGVISEADFRGELAERGYSPGDIDAEVALLLAKMAPTPAPV